MTRGAIIKAWWLGLVAILALAAAYVLVRPAAPIPRKLTVAVARSQDSALVYLADRRGYFRDEGLQVTLQPHEYGKLALDSLLEGKADLATAAETPIMLAIMQGEPLAVIAGIFSSDRNMGLVARRDRGISALRDLRGKRVGATAGTIGDYFRYALLAANGVELNAVKPVSLQPDEMPDALRTDKVDAVAVWQPFLHQCETTLGPAGITFSGEYVATYTFNLVATRRWVSGERETVASFLRALKKAARYADQQPDQSAEIVAHATGLDPALIKSLWGNFTLRLSLEQTLVVGLESQARWAIAEGLVGRRQVPNFLDAIYFDGLMEVSPEAVLITHEVRR